MTTSYYLILDSNNRILFNKVTSTLFSIDVVLLPLVRGNKTSLSLIGIKRAIYSI